MNASTPRIGFDRFVPLELATAALRVRAQRGTLADLDTAIECAVGGVAARKKTRTVLNRLWLAPRPELAGFAQRGVSIFDEDPGVPAAALTWGMAIVAYPFFGHVASLVGRLSMLQGDCTSAEIHRRMSETYGEREGTYRMTNMVLQSQASWGAIERTDNGKRITRLKPCAIQNDSAVEWLVEAALRYIGKPVAVSALAAQSVLFPFVLDRPLGYLASKNPHFVVGSHGPNRQFVSVRVGA